MEEMKNILHFDFKLGSKWFEENYTPLNADKCHFIYALLRIRKLQHLSLIILSLVTAMKKKYLRLLLKTN